MSEPFIVKVQKSLVNTHGYPTILIYDNSGRVTWQGKPSKDFKQKEPKAYWWAILTNDKKIELQGEPLKGDAEVEFELFDFLTMNAKPEVV